VDREKTAIGVLISLEEPTHPMRSEAASAGFYESRGWGKRYPRLQLLTVAELLAGRGIDYPPLAQVNITYRRAPKAALPMVAEQSRLYEAAPAPNPSRKARAPRRQR